MLTESHDPELKIGVRELFDLAIDETVAEEKFSVALQVDDETGEPILPLEKEADDSLLELVFLCDARAQVENDDYSITSAISWVRFAREGIRRVAQHVPSMRGLERAGWFSDSGMEIQVEAYEDMSIRRDIIKGPDESDFSGMQYALRVARGEIILDLDT